MKNFKKAILAILLFYSSAATALNFKLSKQTIDEIKIADRNANIGIKIKNLMTGKVIYQQNENRYYNFASGLKAISIFSLYKYFGPDYLFTNKIIKKDSDYYLDINDPDFSTEDLEVLTDQLTENKITDIKGNFYIVKNEFTLPAQVEGRMIDDSNYCYGAPITKIHINKNCIKFTANPSAKLGKSIYVEAANLAPYKIINKTFTIPDKDLPKIKTFIENDKVIISGTLNKSAKEITIGVVVNNSSVHIENMVRQVLLKNKIDLKGQVLSRDLPYGATLVASISKSFEHVASKALQMSDNFIVDYILGSFGSRYAAKDWRNCGELLKQLANQQFGIDLSQSTIVDGSGLSRYNLLSINQFDDFLSSLYNSPDFERFLPMLATPSKEGTLKKRFKGMKIFAKTGGMTGVSSIIGYAFDKNNVVYSFIIVANDYYGVKQRYHYLEESIIRQITSN